MSQRHLPPQQQDVLSIPATDLAAFDARSLFQLKTLAADRLATAKAEVDHIEYALNLKYGERAKHLRLVAGKDSGVVHFDDGEVRITADLLEQEIRVSNKNSADFECFHFDDLTFFYGMSERERLQRRI